MYLSIYLSTYLSVCLSIYLSICKLENEAILQDVLKFWTWQHQKRSNSARLPQCLNLTTSKTKQFCETSSFFKVDNIKNEAILRDFLQKWKVACSADGLVPMRFAIFQSICLNYCVCHEKVMAGHTKCCTCHAKSSQQTWRPEAPKCSPSQEISAGTSWQLWWTCLLYCACHGKCIFADPLQMSHACHRFWKCHKTLTFCSLLTRCTIPCACNTKRHLNVQKWGGHVVSLYVFNILTSKSALRHNGLHFFDIATSKSGPTLVCFVHFDFEMCFAPQRRALFRHRNFQKWSESGVFCTYWLRHVLRAATTRTFSTSQLPKVVPACGVLYILTWKCASRSTACNFSSLIWPAGSAPAALASLLFDPPETQIIGKTQCFATFLPFRAPASSLFCSSLLSDSSHLRLSSVHIVGSLTSKLPSNIKLWKTCSPSRIILPSMIDARPATLLQNFALDDNREF